MGFVPIYFLFHVHIGSFTLCGEGYTWWYLEVIPGLMLIIIPDGSGEPCDFKMQAKHEFSSLSCLPDPILCL